MRYSKVNSTNTITNMRHNIPINEIITKLDAYSFKGLKSHIVNNRSMIYMFIVSVILQFLAIYNIPLMINVKPLMVSDLAFIVILSLTLMNEARKTLKVKMH